MTQTTDLNVTGLETSTAPSPWVSPLREITFYRTVQLRRAYAVYGTTNEVVVREMEGTTPDGAPARRYPRLLVGAMRRHYAGRTVSVRFVVDDVRLGRLDLDLSSHGSLTSYAVRDVLLALVAMGCARLDAGSGEPHFRIDAAASGIL